MRNNVRAVEALVRDALIDKVETAIDGSLPFAAKERMAWEDIAAIADLIVGDLVTPYAISIAQRPHAVMSALLAEETP